MSLGIEFIDRFFRPVALKELDVAKDAVADEQLKTRVVQEDLLKKLGSADDQAVADMLTGAMGPRRENGALG